VQFILGHPVDEHHYSHGAKYAATIDVKIVQKNKKNVKKRDQNKKRKNVFYI